MCGIGGFIHLNSIKNKNPNDILTKMASAMASRGPDNQGIWLDEDGNTGLCHRRLSILELSDAGNQPMISASGRYIIAYNGETYNHMLLREQLFVAGINYHWNGSSDTETILACIEHWGVRKTLSSLNGMFAIALWDKKLKQLTLARDKFGEKPLYWGWAGNNIFFASDLNALKFHPLFEGNISRDSLDLLLRCNFIPSPYSIYKNVEKLGIGSFVQITPGQERETIKTKTFWSFENVISEGLKNPIDVSVLEATNMLEEVLTNSIMRQKLADVPLGTFLSGGIDSSLVTALLQNTSDKQIQTFSIGFDDPAYNEAVFAGQISKHLGCAHTEVYLGEKDAIDIIPNLPKIYSEPFADSSQLPTFLLSQLAKRNVSVALSGDGADELFGGYNTYQFVPFLWNILKLLPLPIRELIINCLDGLPLPQKIEKIKNILNSKTRESFYSNLISGWHYANSPVIGASFHSTVLENKEKWLPTERFENWMMAADQEHYMSNDILVKVDRAAMANSLETRMPFLDQKVVEFSWQLPIEMKIKHGQGKWLLRRLLYRHVPKELINRPKKGFSIPLAKWLRGPLREWAEELLDESLIKQGGDFSPGIVSATWAKHLNGEQDNSKKLWSILMFQAWKIKK